MGYTHSMGYTVSIEGVGSQIINTTNDKCNENEGDCDSDLDCADGLFCGTNNCPEGFPEGFDCCTTDPFSGYSDAGKNR